MLSDSPNADTLPRVTTTLLEPTTLPPNLLEPTTLPTTLRVPPTLLYQTMEAVTWKKSTITAPQPCSSQRTAILPLPQVTQANILHPHPHTGILPVTATLPPVIILPPRP